MAEANNIDAGQHVKLIHRVIHQMGLRGDEAEEAYSESLVALTVAAQTYDPDRGVPLANWLAKNIRWGIQNWRTKNIRVRNIEIPSILNVLVTDNLMESHYNGDHGNSLPSKIATSALEAPENALSARTSFKGVLAQIERLLTPLERQVILAGAWGYTGKEIAKTLKITEVEVSRAKSRGRAKLEQLREIY